MSTFNGEIKEIQGICVDNFENKSMKCYFLSHCHSDHMKSLENLSQISAPLYTTELSALIIKHRYPLINIHILDYGFAKNIEFIGDDGKEVKFIVTALNATGHCLGASMLLFQIEGHDILYTGDFRISLKHAKSIKLLAEIKSYKNLTLYLDTTFLNDSYTYFPSQNESCEKIMKIIDNHLKQSSSHKVCIQPSARYGYERLLVEINKKFSEKIFIFEPAVYEQYSLISELTSCVTSDKNHSRIHLRPSYIHANAKTDDRNTLTIHLSAMYWKHLTKEKDFELISEKNKSIRVCYATHSSLEELKDFIKFVDPKSINPTVIPSSLKEAASMHSIISTMLKTHSKENTDQEPKRKFRFKRIHSFIEQKNDNKKIRK